jgi:iron complex transport system permease protein
VTNHRRNISLLALAAPVFIGACVFLGGDWTHPASLLAPENAGILHIRLWRVGLGALVGAALAIAGAACQAVLRNPLAEPYSLGIASGGGLAIALVLAGGFASAAGWLLPAAGFAGALLCLGAVQCLARVQGRTAPHTLILAGVACGSLCNSLLMLVVSRSNAEGMHALLWWFLGDLQVYDRSLVVLAAVLIAPAAIALFARARRLNALLLGDDTAAHLGLHSDRERWISLLLATALTACCICVSGIIGFVGLIVPHTARALCGADHRRMIPAAALLGAAFVCVADGLGRTLLYPVEIPVGVFTALAGAPFFLRLLRRRQREIWSGGT